MAKNNRLWSVLGVIGVLIVIVLVGYITLNNSIHRSENNVDQKWANVQSTYQYRSDLVGNLVNTVKGSAKQEQRTLESVVKARASATQTLKTSDDPDEVNKSEGELSSAVSRLLMVVEAYPDLKSQQGFLQLQNQLEGIENRIQVARRDYNTSVRDYNDKVTTFPGSLLGKDKKKPFEAAPGAEKAPQVNFDDTATENSN